MGTQARCLGIGRRFLPPDIEIGPGLALAGAGSRTTGPPREANAMGTFALAVAAGVLVLLIGILYQTVRLWAERRPRHNLRGGSTQRRVDQRRELIDG